MINVTFTGITEEVNFIACAIEDKSSDVTNMNVVFRNISDTKVDILRYKARVKIECIKTSEIPEVTWLN